MPWLSIPDLLSIPDSDLFRADSPSWGMAGRILVSDPHLLTSDIVVDGRRNAKNFLIGREQPFAMSSERVNGWFAEACRLFSSKNQ